MATLNKRTGAEEPTLITTYKNNETNEYTYACININVVKLTDGTFEWDALELPDYAVDNIHNADLNTKYSVMVSHIITAYYNDHQMTAIMNNYMFEPNNDKYVKEFNKMQKVRKLAKEVANHIVTNNLF